MAAARKALVEMNETIRRIYVAKGKSHDDIVRNYGYGEIIVILFQDLKKMVLKWKYGLVIFLLKK